MTPARLEGNPTDEQKQRLEDWLVQLKIICREYQLLLDTDDGETHVVDLRTGTTIGIGLSYLVNEDGRITGYDCTGSILDGVWLVDSPVGLIEQREAGGPWPRRPSRERPR